MRRTLVLWSLLVAALSFAYHQTVVLDQDVSFNYLAGLWMLDGRRLYVDIVEINPPLVFYLGMPGGILARGLGLSAATGLQVWLHMLGLVSLGLCGPAVRRRPVLAAVLPLVVFVLPGMAWGQREHLLLVFTLPWLLMTARAGGRVAGPPWRVLFAVPGILLKPFFLGLPLAVLGAVAWSRRDWRSLFGRDSWILAGCGLSYIGAVAWAHPEYLGEMVPRAVLVYGVFDHTVSQLTAVRAHVLLAPLIGLLALRAGGWPGGQVAGHRRRLLLLAVAAAFASYYVQRKGWEYHALPAVSLTVLFLVDCAGDLRGAGRWLAVAAALVAGVFRFDPAPSIAGYLRSPLASYVADRPGVKLSALSNNSLLTFPLMLYAEATWASRFQLLWPVAGLAAAQADGRAGAFHRGVAQWLAEAVAEDLTRLRPDAVAVDSTILHDQPFDYVAFLSVHAAFRAAWQHYRECRRLGDGVTLFTRKGSGACGEGLAGGGKPDGADQKGKPGKEAISFGALG